MVTAVFLAAAFVLQLILAPRQMEQDATQAYEARIAELSDALANAQAATAPSDAIRRINAHLDEGRNIVAKVRRVPRDAPDEEWTPYLKECVDWLRVVGELVNELCLGKSHEFGNLWRTVPTVIRNAGRNPDGSPWVSGRAARWREWIAGGTALLLGCIERVEGRSSG
jgi:hypothetical protein